VGAKILGFALPPASLIVALRAEGAASPKILGFRSSDLPVKKSGDS
jgi:hypothetical protein